MICEVCDREGCPVQADRYGRPVERCADCTRPVWDGGHAQNACECDSPGGEVCRLVARAIAGRAREAALQAEVERLTADDNTAADQFRVAIEEHLPEYALSSNDADLANHKAEAHRLAHKLRDPKFYTARTRRAVNSGGAR